MKFLCLMVVLAGCANSKDELNITGAWYLVTNDSVYDEAIFTKRNFWSLTETSAQLFGKYKVENDSFKYLQLNDQLIRALLYSRISENEFLISDPPFKSHYYRLTIPLDTSSLINGRDNKLLDSYIIGLRDRRLKWKSDYKK